MYLTKLSVDRLDLSKYIQALEARPNIAQFLQFVSKTKKNKTQQRSWKLDLYYHSCPSYHYYFNFFLRFVYVFNTELPAC